MSDATAATPQGAIAGGPRPKIDGRVLRAARTRERIVNATIDLIRGGESTPRVIDIARTAGVSTRSIFQHFDDTEALFAAVAQQVVESLMPLAKPIESTLPWEERLDALMRMRIQINEALLPFRRAVALHQPRSPKIAAGVTAGRLFARERAESAFAPELMRMPEAERKQTVDALLAASDWQMWFGLRMTYGLDLDAAAATMRRMVGSILMQATSSRELSSVVAA
ncbi:TetR/AcrR family transcriptional regulator [Reyranella sp. CPCC 100927]|uniref:TetR/AcrR family transcriptional regulator n=1 Tax=Reyranella sp. CPCC 100927 TaxID=2599616 RepID=UPI0011B6253F|nr:TetR/AcrR family transcriptional regulator [Reyranella sp. CPCC 100927]TWT15766.1 TetR/AcrR family transcriptional regulator [Reyranella sp. CPCC 100927]